MTTIIERLEAVRRHYDLSGRGLADRLGQRPSTVTNYFLDSSRSRQNGSYEARAVCLSLTSPT